ncbi:helix-turn-helix domain-containing protein [Uliginosibacterium sediminicola]|uniref:Helix-turn-helix domain-containing protein n=1 Tax=Uliginosibacterium sediminicola TaxID=2024550 RepID=A0ABU9YX67_9RHOO
MNETLTSPKQSWSARFGHEVVRETHSADAEEHARGLRGWQLSFDQLAAGRFRAHCLEFMLDHMQLVHEHTNLSLGKAGQAIEGSVVFSLPLAADGEGACSGRRLGIPSVLLADGAALPEVRTPDALELVYIAIERGFLVEAAHCRGFDGLPKLLAGTSFLELPLSKARLLSDRLRHLLEQLQQARPYLHLQSLRQQVEQKVLDILLFTLYDAERVQMLALDRSQKLVSRARCVALETPAFPPGIDELCRRIGVSRRKLQNCFQQSLGLSPAQYLKTIRLNAVRRDLRKQPAARVGDIAANWGFWHAGRFSAEYRELFGELPSVTLTQHPGGFGKA